jgi:membrane protease YdiL (CAAX protease family)
MVRKFIEFVILIISFFIPNLVVVSIPGASDMLNTDWVLLLYVACAILQFLFMCYIVKTGNNCSFDEMGFTRNGLYEIWKIIFTSCGIIALYFLFSLLIAVLPQAMQKNITEGYNWKLTSLYRIPLVIIFCIVTGYREEFLFRSYFLTMLSGFKSPIVLSIMLGTILFALLHSYEGIAAMVFAGVAGLFFSFVFYRTKNLHIIAFAHGIFNSLIIVLSFFS